MKTMEKQNQQHTRRERKFWKYPKLSDAACGCQIKDILKRQYRQRLKQKGKRGIEYGQKRPEKDSWVAQRQDCICTLVYRDPVYLFYLYVKET